MFYVIVGISVLVGGGMLSVGVLIVFVMLVVVIYVVYFMCFGCNVYVVGGNECLVLLMGLLVVCMKIGVYVLSGFCLVFGGVVFMLYVLLGYGL